MKIYVLEMAGPEWTEVLGLYADPVPTVPRAELRALAARDALRAGDPVALQLVPKGMRTASYVGLSNFNVVVKKSL